MIGFSFGGAVTLITAGAVPNLAHLSAYCRNNADDRRACGGVSVDSPTRQRALCEISEYASLQGHRSDGAVRRIV